MNFKIKCFLMFLFTAFAASVPQSVYGVPAVILSNQVAMDFGLIEYSGAGSARMGTNGNVTYTGGFTGAGLGTSGAVLATLTNSTQATVACSATATIANTSGYILVVSNIEFVVGSTNRTNFGAGRACAGVATSSGTFTFSGAVNNRTIYLGGRINAAGLLSGAGVYSSANPGGTSITVVVTAI